MTERHGPQRGFTLVELMVATAVLSVMVLMLMEVLNRTSSAWTLGQAQAERRQSARSVADVIARELEPALMPVWQAPIAADRSRGDVAEVGYFLKWKLPVPNDPKNDVWRPQLCRFFVNPTERDNYLILTNPTQWLSVDLLDSVAPATAGSGYAGLFAENVIGFWVRCYDKNGQCLKDYDSRVTHVLPRTVKIYLVLLGPTGLARLYQKPDYDMAGAGDEPDLQAFINSLPVGIRQAARPFVTEVYLQNAQ
ncbi:MAG: prepilin-type N-terminal cleavage/methylation domain-containing protein [Verrucomicrobia bacterium]|nr:prepilin-type N-terminal cleavage/methylation domain-containing protein [Verrucomicrobiota bacterium]